MPSAVLVLFIDDVPTDNPETLTARMMAVMSWGGGIQKEIESLEGRVVGRQILPPLDITEGFPIWFQMNGRLVKVDQYNIDKYRASLDRSLKGIGFK